MEVGNDVRGFFKCYVFGFLLICPSPAESVIIFISGKHFVCCHHVIWNSKGKKSGVCIYQIMPKDSQSILNTFFSLIIQSHDQCDASQNGRCYHE